MERIERTGTGGPGDHGIAGAGWPALEALVSSLLATRREVAALQAQEARLLADAVQLVVTRTEEYRQASSRRALSDLPLREVSLELGAAMRVSDRSVQGRMGDADALVNRFSATLAAWESGRIDAGHAWAIVKAGSPILREDARIRFEELALAAAETESPGRLAAVARALAASLDPEAFAHRLRRGSDDRSVRVYDIEDGLARLVADLPAPLAYAIRDRLTQLARAALVDTECPTAEQQSGSAVADKNLGGGEAADLTGHDRLVTGPTGQRQTDLSPGESALVPAADGEADDRTLDQTRADVLADLLLAGTPAGHGRGDALPAITGHIQVTIPVLTLAGAGDEPALLAGYGPIDPAIARRLAGAAPGWDRILIDANTGAPVAVDRYRPSAELTRFLAARDERCRTPGCTRPARRCDIDHTKARADGGQTAEENLANFCRRHHVGKHGTAWRVRQLGRGVLEWTGPTGRRYLDKPPATLRFVPAMHPEGAAPF